MNMYKKIGKIIIVCIGCMGNIFGMEMENIFKQTVQRNMIPILAINNYVMPISSAYRALQKEVSLSYECLEKIKVMSKNTINSINIYIKGSQQKKNNVVTCIPFIKKPKDVLHPAGYSFVKCIEVLYIPEGEYIKAYIIAKRFIYCVKDTHFKARKYSEHRYIVKNISQNIVQKLPKKISTCFLLHSGDEYLVDRIVIRNMCNIIQRFPVEKSITGQLVDKSPRNMSEPNFHILPDDREDIKCQSGCKRIMLIISA